jgi:hypothetical protein
MKTVKISFFLIIVLFVTLTILIGQYIPDKFLGGKIRVATNFGKLPSITITDPSIFHNDLYWVLFQTNINGTNYQAGFYRVNKNYLGINWYYFAPENPPIGKLN